MNIFEKYLNSISYKFPKGYPDLNDPKDLTLLESLINDVLDEKISLTESNEAFDARIKAALGVKVIPKCKTPLSVGTSFSLQGEDKNTWSQLYPVKPLKTGTQTPTAGSGNGEIATYWAFQHNVKSINSEDGRGKENPDLIIGGIGVEVKSYDSKTITLGKFRNDTENVNLLNKVFSTLSLFAEEVVQANTGNFNPKSLITGFTLISGIYNNPGLKKLDVAKPFFNKIDILYKELGLSIDSASPEQATAALLRRLLWTKLSKKPNLNQEIGYILNVDEEGNGQFTQITKEVIYNLPDENILSGVAVRASEISMNFNTLFK